MDEEGRGRVILLNGASSSGKTTIAQALLPLLPGVWFHAPVDAVNAMRARQDLQEDHLEDVLRRTRLGYHRVVAGLASVGNDVVMDYPLSEKWRLDDLLDVLGPYDVTLVEVRCAPEVLQARERERGDRPAGLARSQRTVYEIEDRDVVVDTAETGTEECARAVVDQWSRLTPPKAFARLRAGADRGETGRSGPEPGP